MSIDLATERPLIEAETALYAPDLLLPILLALRTVSDGSKGEFGLLTVSAPTYAEQLHIAAKTVAHALWSYPGNPLTETPSGQLRVRDGWVAYFASIFVPQGAVNDPSGSNAGWVKSFLAAYSGFIQPLKGDTIKGTFGPTVTFVGARPLPNPAAGGTMKTNPLAKG